MDGEPIQKKEQWQKMQLGIIVSLFSLNGNELSDDVYFAIRLKSVTYHKKVDDSDNDENDEDITITMESVEDARVDINLLWDKDL